MGDCPLCFDINLKSNFFDFLFMSIAIYHYLHDAVQHSSQVYVMDKLGT
jgi:hypothetical protein|tara:strand:- start:1700 stop:1846 length:147 start_codon:yes stop_codon:yes gene_type:complete